MEFYDLPSMVDAFAASYERRLGKKWTGDWAAYVANLEASMPPEGDPRWLAMQLVLGEVLWIMTRCPYYAIYPTVLGPALRMTLEVTPGQAQLPLPSLLLKLPKVDHELSWEDSAGKHFVQTVLVSGYTGIISVAFFCDQDRSRYNGSWAFPIRPKPENGWDSSATFADLVRKPERLFGRASKREVPQSVYEQVMRLVAFVCLIDPTDSDLISPDLLEKDFKKGKKHSIGIEGPITRAHLAGRWWSVGKGMEPVPGFRKARFGLRWTGESRNVPKVVPVEGAWVRKC